MSMSWNLRKAGARRTIAFCLGGLFLALAAYQVWGDHGYRALQRRRQEVREWEAKNQALHKHNSKLEKRIDDLHNRRGLIEKLAREDLRLGRPGERIIHSPQKP